MRIEHAGVLPFVVVVALGTGTGIRAQTIVSPTVEAEIETAPVELDGVALFRVRGVSSLPSNERARRIQQQLVTFAADQSHAIDSLRRVDGNNTTRVMAGDLPLMTIVDADADLEQIGRVELASAHLDRIRRAALEYRQARSPTAHCMCSTSVGLIPPSPLRA